MTESATPSPRLKINWKIVLARTLALVFVILLSFFLVSIRDRVDNLESYGYPGIFLTALLSNATVLFPAPGLAVVFAMGSVFNPLGVALAAATGGAIGELSGYLAGWSGQAVVERIDVYKKVAPAIQKYGPWTIFFLCTIPNPVFDVAGIAAGALKMPFLRFFLAVWAGLLVKMLLFAFAGSLSLNWLFGK